MLEIMEEVGEAIRANFDFIPWFVSIYLVIDNAGSHGIKEALLKNKTVLDLKYNIKIWHQIPSSPDTNMLDLGGWHSLQANTEMLGYQQCKDPDMLAKTVMQVWHDCGAKVLENIILWGLRKNHQVHSWVGTLCCVFITK